jgi:hypothetical protein
MVTLQFVYYCFSTFMSWFLLANFYLSFLVLLQGEQALLIKCTVD